MIWEAIANLACLSAAATRGELTSYSSSEAGSFQRGLRRRTRLDRSVRWLYMSLPSVMLTPLSMLRCQ